MEPITSLREGDMESLPPESKTTGRNSLRLIKSSLIYVLMPPTNDEFYEAAVG